jgi:hypothetical protein
MATRLLLGLLVVGFAAASVLTNVPAPASPCATPCNCAQADMDPKWVWNSMLPMSSTTSGTGTPPGPTIAVGPDRIFVSAGTSFRLLNKTTNEVIATWGAGLLFSGTTRINAYLSFDNIHQRFIATWLQYYFCSQLLTVQNGPSAGSVLCATMGLFGPQTGWAVTGALVVPTPDNTACTAIGNCAAFAGNIALLKRGSCFFVTAIYNAQLCGATAAIEYDNVLEQLVVMAGPPTPVITIPSVFINLTDGTALSTVANTTGVNVTLNSVFVTTFTGAQVVVAMSQGTSPNSQADFFVHAYTNPLWNNSLHGGTRHTATSDTLYITTQLFGEQLPNQSITYTGTSIAALQKIPLLGGALPTAFWYKTLPATQSPVVVADQRILLLSQNPNGWFVGLGATEATPTCATEVTHLAVYWGTSATQPSSTPYLLPLPTPICALAQNLAGFTTVPVPMGARQPPPAVPAGLQVDPSFSSATTDGNIIAFTFAFNVSSVHTIAAWGTIDLSTFWSNGQLSLAQFGFVNPVPGALDVIYPKIDIDSQGNIVLAGTTSSTSQYVAGSYTGRLAGDPLGMLRYPLVNWARSNNTYLVLNGVRNPDGDCIYADNVNHWGNNQGLARDPNGKDFFAFAAVPNPAGPFDGSGRTTTWTTSLTTFQINNAPGCTPKYPTTPQATPVNLAFEARYAAAHPTGFVASASSGDTAPQAYDGAADAGATLA